MVIILVMMQLAKKVPFDNPDVLLLVRGIYVLSNALILGLYLYTQSKINSKKGMHRYQSMESHTTNTDQRTDPESIL